MKNIIHISLIILSTISYAEENKQIEIINANKTYANQIKHPDFWRLIGDVCFKHNNTYMYCDSAYHYINKNKIIAFNNIKINQADSLKLNGDKLNYNGQNNKAEIIGNVVIIDKHMKLETNKVIYNLLTDIASYPEKGKITDKEKIINSKKGSYNSQLNIFTFKDSVIVLGKEYKIHTNNMNYNAKTEVTSFYGPSYILSEKNTIYCENGWYNTITNISQFNQNSSIYNEDYILMGDSLYYNKDLGYGKALRNVKLTDTIKKINIYGELGEYFENKEEIEIKNKPWLELYNNKDTLYMHAKKFISSQLNNKTYILAYNKVKFFKRDLQGKCDSLIYLHSDSIIKMIKKPVLWSENMQITADSLEMKVYNGIVEKLFLSHKPLVIEKVDSLDFNQIKGKRMIGFLKNNKITHFDIDGNGQTIFIVKNEKDEKIGLNYIESSNLSMYFKKNKLTNLTYHLLPISNTTPYIQIEENKKYLDDFIWRESEKPMNKKEIFIE